MSGPARKYSIWLGPAPESPLHHPLQSIIDTFSAQPTAYHLNSPSAPFPPHITLGSGLRTSNIEDDIIKPLTSLFQSKEFKNVRISLLKPVFGTMYFKRIYLAVEKSPELAGLARQCCQGLGLTFDEDGYDPHLSLAYNNGFKESSKPMVEELIEEKTVLGPGWLGGVVTVVDTTDEVSTWKTVFEHEL